MKTNIEKVICDAIEIIVNRKIATATFDKTIKAHVLECTDAATGKHRCEYLGAKFDAYSINNFAFDKDDYVYILVPEGNFDNQKVILNKIR